jgi:uncharacterized integral membrane protein
MEWTMRIFLKALFFVPLALLLVLFAVANRQSVRLSLDPVSRDAPLYAFDVPLFAIVLATLALGILVGGAATWLAQGKNRKAKRQLGKEAARLRSEAATLRSTLDDSMGRTGAAIALTSRRG